jgi:hypothetical protein
MSPFRQIILVEDGGADLASGLKSPVLEFKIRKVVQVSIFVPFAIVRLYGSPYRKSYPTLADSSAASLPVTPYVYSMAN